MFKNFQHRLAISPTSLHTVVFIMIVAWILAPKPAPAESTMGLWNLMPNIITGGGLMNTLLAFICASAVVYILGELNISQILLRVNSRAISFTFAALITAATFTHCMQAGVVLMLCLLLSYFTLFSAYQIEDSATLIYVSFLYLGTGILIYPQAVWFVPVYWLSVYILRAINSRSMCASVLGLITPLWVAGSIAYCTDHIQMISQLFSQMVDFSWGGYSTLTAPQILILVVALLLFLISFVDFYTRWGLDKTRTRILLSIVSLHGMVIYLTILLQPTHLHTLIPVAFIPTAIMGGHYVANDATPISNIMTWTLTLAIIIGFILSSWIL